MAVEVAIILGKSPQEIYEGWYPSQLVSTYSYLINMKYKENYNKIEDKDKSKFPEVLVERLLDEGETKKYLETRRRMLSKRVSKLKTGKK